MYSNFKPKGERPSQIQMNHLVAAFPWICWDFSKTECRRYGYGDRPQYEYVGSLRDRPDVEATYKNQSPGGSPATFCLRFSRTGKVKLFRDAPFLKAKQIKKNVDEILKQWS